MSFLKKILKPSFRNYTLTLCVFYLLLVFFFHSNLDPSHHNRRDQSSDVTRKPQGDRLQANQIEERANRPEVRIDPDSQAARYLKEYRAVYANPVGEVYQRNHSDVIHADDGGSCRGVPMRETHDFIPLAAELYVYSVFWDPRPNDFDNKQSGVYLRIMAVIRRSAAEAQAPVYCIFLDSTGGKIPIKTTYYEMCENHGREYGGHILSCKVPPEIYGANKTVPPCRIRLSGTTDYDHSLARDFKVVNTVAVEKQRDFSICVAPLYGEIPHSQLIEFMELSSLLGASHVTFYDFSISAETMSLLNYFESKNRVTVIPWRMKATMDLSIWYHGQLVSILDCLYRNMAITKYLAFNDIDEYMVPYNYTNWYKMMEALDSPDKCGFQFNSVFIDPGVQEPHEGPAEYQGLRTITNSLRSIVTSRMRTKCMVKPQLIFEAGIHHISKPILAHLQTIRMDLPLAILHHHRQCQPNYGMNCKDRVSDSIVRTRYADVLYKQFSRTKNEFESLLKGKN